MPRVTGEVKSRASALALRGMCQLYTDDCQGAIEMVAAAGAIFDRLDDVIMTMQ